MKKHQNPIQKLEEKIARAGEVVKKWDAAAARCDTSTEVGRCTAKYARNFADHHRQRKEKLEAELKALNA